MGFFNLPHEEFVVGDACVPEYVVLKVLGFRDFGSFASFEICLIIKSGGRLCSSVNFPSVPQCFE